MPKIALVSRDDGRRLAAVAAALESRHISTRLLRYDEAREAEFGAELESVDAALVWVNPMQDGRDRRGLDRILRRAAAAGALISGHPDVIDRMGVKRVLTATAALGWSGGVAAYDTAAALRTLFPARVAAGPKVLKPNRGAGGGGVWKVEALGPARVRVMEAADRHTVRDLPLDQFLSDRVAEFEHVEGFVDQAFQPRLGDGMIRCYLSGGRVAGFGWQMVRALMPPEAGPAPSRAYSGPDDARFQVLRHRMEGEWAPRLAATLGLSEADLPVIWDADFLFGPPDASGRDSYVLCEINASSVFPMPDEAPAALADTLAARLATTHSA